MRLLTQKMMREEIIFKDLKKKHQTLFSPFFYQNIKLLENFFHILNVKSMWMKEKPKERRRKNSNRITLLYINPLNGKQ